jgi:hypothetical protein
MGAVVSKKRHRVRHNNGIVHALLGNSKLYSLSVVLSIKFLLSLESRE